MGKKSHWALVIPPCDFLIKSKLIKLVFCILTGSREPGAPIKHAAVQVWSPAPAMSRLRRLGTALSREYEGATGRINERHFEAPDRRIGSPLLQQRGEVPAGEGRLVLCGRRLHWNCEKTRAGQRQRADESKKHEYDILDRQMLASMWLTHIP